MRTPARRLTAFSSTRHKMDNLPASVRELIAAIGLQPTLALVQTYGGRTLRVPTGARAEKQVRERLIGLLGSGPALTLIRHYGGERITVARCAALLRDERDTAIIAAYTAGRSVPALAGEHLLTERQIRTILKRTPGSGLPNPADERQLSLVF